MKSTRFPYSMSGVPKRVAGASQHCTFCMSPLSDTPISGLGVSVSNCFQFKVVKTGI